MVKCEINAAFVYDHKTTKNSGKNNHRIHTVIEAPNFSQPHITKNCEESIGRRMKTMEGREL